MTGAADLMVMGAATVLLVAGSAKIVQPAPVAATLAELWQAIGGRPRGSGWQFSGRLLGVFEVVLACVIVIERSAAAGPCFVVVRCWSGCRGRCRDCQHQQGVLRLFRSVGPNSWVAADSPVAVVGGSCVGCGTRPIAVRRGDPAGGGVVHARMLRRAVHFVGGYAALAKGAHDRFSPAHCFRPPDHGSGFGSRGVCVVVAAVGNCRRGTSSVWAGRVGGDGVVS